VSRRRRTALLVAVAAQLALPLALAGIAAADLAFGREIRLRAEPVDPLDPFRGNYVVLRYDISAVTALASFERGDRVCVELHEAGDARTGDFARTEPTGDVAICGRARRAAQRSDTVEVEYGIETYFASAGRARELEDAIAARDLHVVVDLDDDGSARIERVEVG
jgi:uncharacterized membrane-anchored protein